MTKSILIKFYTSISRPRLQIKKIVKYFLSELGEVILRRFLSQLKLRKVPENQSLHPQGRYLQIYHS